MRQEDIEYMRTRGRIHESEPDGGSRDREGGKGDRGRMAREMRRMACGEERFQEL